MLRVKGEGLCLCVFIEILLICFIVGRMYTLSVIAGVRMVHNNHAAQYKVSIDIQISEFFVLEV